jgi:hypothetical protein
MRVLEPVPFIFAGDGDAYREWRHDLGARLKVDPRALAIVGSASTGVSLSLRKNLAHFHDGSDVDVAVISMVHFEGAWQWLRQLGADFYDLPPAAKESVKEHRERLVYWATIATDVLIGHMPIGSAWVPALAAIGQKTPPSVRTVNVRLYRDFEALRAYQALGVTELARTPLVKGASV